MWRFGARVVVLRRVGPWARTARVSQHLLKSRASNVGPTPSRRGKTDVRPCAAAEGAAQHARSAQELRGPPGGKPAARAQLRAPRPPPLPFPRCGSQRRAPPRRTRTTSRRLPARWPSPSTATAPGRRSCSCTAPAATAACGIRWSAPWRASAASSRSTSRASPAPRTSTPTRALRASPMPWSAGSPIRASTARTSRATRWEAASPSSSRAGTPWPRPPRCPPSASGPRGSSPSPSARCARRARSSGACGPRCRR